MDPSQTNPAPAGAGMGASGPAPAPVGPAPLGASPSKSTPEQRARWREKARLAYQRRRARQLGLPDPAPAVGVVEGTGADPGAAAAPGVAPVPWSADVLAPLFGAVLPEVERLDVESLKAKAAPLGPELVAMVEKDAAWNPIAKKTLLETGPAVVSQLLNSVGIPAQHAPTVALLGAVGAIVTGRQLLAQKLDAMARARAESRPEAPAP